MHKILPKVRHASELTPEIIQQFPYDLQYDIHHQGMKPEKLVERARIAAHIIDTTPCGAYETFTDFERKLAEQLAAFGFIRDDLDQPTARVIWLYYSVAIAPKGWFNQVYEVQPNLNPVFIDNIVATIDRVFQDFDLADRVKEWYGLLPEQLADTEDTTATSSSCWSLEPMGFYRHKLAIDLPPFHGLGGPAADRVDELITELRQLLKENCLPDVKVGYVRHQLHELADMRYGPDLEELERAYQQPLSQIWLRPETYGVLHELGFETVGDILANREALIEDYLPLTDVGNRLVLAELRDRLFLSGYTLNLPSLSIARP